MSKHFIKMRWVFFLCVFCMLTYQTEAQRISRQSINANGGTYKAGSVTIRQTIGQPYGFYSSGKGYQSGFQQAAIIVENDTKPLDQSVTVDVYPNPSSERVNLRFDQFMSKIFLQVVDLSGNVVVDEQLKEVDKAEIDCSTWESGVYFLRILSDGQTKYSSKLIITN